MARILSPSTRQRWRCWWHIHHQLTLWSISKNKAKLNQIYFVINTGVSSSITGIVGYCMYVFMYVLYCIVCMYVCMSVCLCVCVSVYVCVCLCVYVCVSLCVCMYVYVYVYIYEFGPISKGKSYRNSCWIFHKGSLWRRAL